MASEEQLGAATVGGATHLSLAGLQELFQRAILTGDLAILAELCDCGKTSSATLLGVYQSAYFARLAEVVRAEYAVLAAYLGETDFERLVRDYISHHPSEFRSARWVGSRLPEYLASHALGMHRAEVKDLAALERALSDCFDGADEPVLRLDELAHLAPADWSGLLFSIHPTAHRVDLRSNAFDIWRALRNAEAPPLAEAGSEIVRVLITRREATPVVRVLGPEEAMLWDELVRATPFGRLCELAAAFDAPANAAARMAGYLQSWLAGGALTCPRPAEMLLPQSHAAE